MKRQQDLETRIQAHRDKLLERIADRREASTYLDAIDAALLALSDIPEACDAVRPLNDLRQYFQFGWGLNLMEEQERQSVGGVLSQSG
jgi:hypothetical protein